MRFQLCYINDDDPKDFLCGDNAKCADKGLLLPIFLVRETKKNYIFPNRKKMPQTKKGDKRFPACHRLSCCCTCFFSHFLFQFRFYFSPLPERGKGRHPAVRCSEHGAINLILFSFSPAFCNLAKRCQVVKSIFSPSVVFALLWRMFCSVHTVFAVGAFAGAKKLCCP